MRDTDDDAIFETIIDHNGQPRRILRNGATTRVPLAMMDSMQRAVHDATVNDLERLKALRDEAYRDREHIDANAWRGDANKRTCPNCGFPLSKGYLTRAGGNGDETDELDDAALSDPHNKNFNLDSARAARDAARAAREVEDQAAWRKGKPGSPNARRDG